MSADKNSNEPFKALPVIDITTSQSFTIDTTSNEASTSDIAGRHYIVDFWGAQFLNDAHKLELGLTQAAKVAGAVLLHIHLHKFSQGGGVTGVALLAESHISVHTWPERDYAAFDIFMCGNAQPEKAMEYLKEAFMPEKAEIKEILRGKE